MLWALLSFFWLIFPWRSKNNFKFTASNWRTASSLIENSDLNRASSKGSPVIAVVFPLVMMAVMVNWAMSCPGFSVRTV